MTGIPDSSKVPGEGSVTTVMLKVLLAPLPGLVAYVWFFGAGIVINLLIASATALVAEATVLRARARPIPLHLTDLSAVVTAWLIALAFPASAP